jgi:uncharacterized protein DUF6000
MPLKTEEKRKAAMEIVTAEERSRGWAPELPGSWAKEKEHGCDILSAPPDGGPAHPIEVKGWGEPLLNANRTFTYPQDIRASQYQAARRSEVYRLEIVANLDAHLQNTGSYQRLTLTAQDILERAIPRLYDIPLTGLEEKVWSVTTMTERQLLELVDPLYMGLVDTNFLDTSGIERSTFTKSVWSQLAGLDLSSIAALLRHENWRHNIVGGWAVALRRDPALASLIPNLLHEREHLAVQGYCVALAAVPSDHGADALYEHAQTRINQHGQTSTWWAMGALALLANDHSHARRLYRLLVNDADRSSRGDERAQRKATVIRNALALLHTGAI